MLKKTAAEACSAFDHVESFVPFVDASSHPNRFELYIEDCLKGFEKCVKLGWFDIETFNLKEYDCLSSIENGGLNWIIPNKLLAFISPASEKTSKYPALTPELYSSLFKNLGVTDVIRLNNKTYEADRFLRLGINHHDLYFLDGSCPSENIIERFLEIVENCSGAVAVHCKAGLGRTATLIGCYAIKHYGFTGLEFIAWARLSRPGSVLGPQQQFLCDRYDAMHGTVTRTVKTTQDSYQAKYGDYGQSARLVNRSTPSSPVLSSSKKLLKIFVQSKPSSMKSLPRKK